MLITLLLVVTIVLLVALVRTVAKGATVLTALTSTVVTQGQVIEQQRAAIDDLSRLVLADTPDEAQAPGLPPWVD